MWPVIPPVALNAKEHAAGEDLLRSVVCKLSKLDVPSDEDSVWIGPFDQLATCAYALLQAENRGFHARETEAYYTDVFAKIARLLFAKTPDDSAVVALNNYVSSFYFNAGIQRLTFAAERLIATFCGVYCDCGKEPMVKRGERTPSWLALLRLGQCRLEHPHFATLLPDFRQMLSRARGWDQKSYAPDKCIALLREQVNPKKHSIYDRTWVMEHKPIMPETRWLPTDQMSIAVEGFGLVCRAYSELLAWNPVPQR